MMRILLPGTNRGCRPAGNRRRRSQGFVLLDALLCVFITGLIFLIIQGASSAHRRIALSATGNVTRILEERNTFDLERMDRHE